MILELLLGVGFCTIANLIMFKSYLDIRNLNQMGNK